LQDLENETSDDGFWELSQGERTVLLKQVSRLSDSIQGWETLDSLHDDLEAAAELYREEDDADLLKEILDSCEKLDNDIDSLEITGLFNGEADDRNAIVSIHPGAGGTESTDWASMLYDMYRRWIAEEGFKFQLLDYQPGDEAGIKSVPFSVSGPYVYGKLKTEIGVHRLVRISPLDSQKRRHTSFASVFVYAENTAVIKDKSTDEKLDYLISEMEELKSQQSSDDMKKWTTNRGLKALLPRQSLSEDWSEKYRYGSYGFVIATFEDAYSINLLIERNHEWGYGFSYSQIGNKIVKRFITIKEGHSITATGVGVGVHPTYFINDDLYIHMVCGVGYTMINWEDKEQNTSGKFSNINASISPQINLNILEREQPLPMRVYLNFGINLGYFPSSYEIDNEIVKLADWKIRIVPVLAIGFFFPSHKP